MSFPAPVFPTCFALKGDSAVETFLYLLAGHTKRENYGKFYEVGTREALTTKMHTRFYLVPSKEHGEDEALVHIRTSYNNKYLVAKETDKWIGVILAMDTVDEPNEKLSDPLCTLFKIKVVSEHAGIYKVRFIQPFRNESSRFECSPVKANFQHFRDEVYLIDLTDHIVLPPQVSFRNSAGFYIRVFSESDPSLRFYGKEDPDTSSSFTTLNFADGQVYIRSELNGKFLGLKEDRIVAHSAENELNIVSNSFKVLQFGEFVVLKSAANNHFCNGEITGGTVLLRAGDENMDEAALILEEPVRSREIYNIEFHKDDHARIFDTKDMSMATTSAINRGSEKNTFKSSISFTTTESGKFDTTKTHKTNVSATVSAGVKLKVFESSLQFQVGHEYTYEETLGTGWQKDKLVHVEYEVTVPAKKKVTLTVISKQSTFDVPYSYTQKDTLLNGETKIYNYHDGLYTGMNSSDFHYETNEEEIDTKKRKPEEDASKGREEKPSKS